MDADPFRQFFLNTVQSIVKKEANLVNLHQLLQMVSPSLTTDQLRRKDYGDRATSSNGSATWNSNERSKAFKLLKLRIHPDKHPNDFQLATTLFQNVQLFFDQCCENIDQSNTVVPFDVDSSDQTKKRRKTGDNRRRNPHRDVFVDDCDNDEAQDLGSDDSFHNTDQRHETSTFPSEFPLEFLVSTKWNFMTLDSPSSQQVHAATSSRRNEDDNYSPSENLASMTAFRCLNARGAVAHGKKITKEFTWEDVQKYTNEFYSRRKRKQSTADQSTSDESIFHSIFQQYGGGVKVLTSVAKIKQELMTHGPIISTSFRLRSDYFDRLVGVNEPYSDCFVKERVGGVHELLIVGWTLTPFGEMWLVQPVYPLTSSMSTNGSICRYSNCFIPISVGHFGINDRCIAPKLGVLDHISWQVGPYFDIDFRDTPDWRCWQEMDVPLIDTEMRILFETFLPQGIVDAYTGRHSLVIRDKNKLAYSETYNVKELKWDQSTKEWFLTIAKID